MLVSVVCAKAGRYQTYEITRRENSGIAGICTSVECSWFPARRYRSILASFRIGKLPLARYSFNAIQTQVYRQVRWQRNLVPDPYEVHTAHESGEMLFSGNLCLWSWCLKRELVRFFGLWWEDEDRVATSHRANYCVVIDSSALLAVSINAPWVYSTSDSHPFPMHH